MNRLVRSLYPACADLLTTDLAQTETLRAGGKTFTEQRILTTITTQFLQRRGYDVTVTTSLGSTLARTTQESGQLDIVWRYTGSLLIIYGRIDERLDAAASYRRIKQLDGAQGLVWLKPTHFNDIYALAMPEEQAERLGIQSVDGLAQMLAEQQEARPGSTHLFAMGPKFAGRPDSLGPMSELYGLHFIRNDIRQMGARPVYTALRDHQMFPGFVYATDGHLKNFKLCVLRDGKQYFLFYNAVPVVRKEIMQCHPEFATLFDPIIERLDDAAMQVLNVRVDIEQQTPQKVAVDFLREHRLFGDGRVSQGGSQ